MYFYRKFVKKSTVGRASHALRSGHCDLVIVLYEICPRYNLEPHNHIDEQEICYTSHCMFLLIFQLVTCNYNGLKHREQQNVRDNVI
jgi:hypothetical protein